MVEVVADATAPTFTAAITAGAAAGLSLIPTHIATAMTTATATAAYSGREMYRRLGALYARLGASGRTQALLHAERCGLLDT